MVESDSLVMIHALNGISAPPFTVSAVIQGILDLSKAFRRVKFSHVKRQGNRPIHALAKHALCIINFVAWIEEIPYFLK